MFTNVCEFLSCSYYRKGAQRQSLDGFGCARYCTAASCTVAQIRGVEASEYQLTTPLNIEEDSFRLATMRSACPDPIVRLAALGEYPVEPARNFIANSEALLDGAGDRLKTAIENLRIGPKSPREADG
jgi:hypothetical protein